MTITEIATHANNITDENYSNSMIMGFVNQAVAKTNATLHAQLPLFTSVDTTYTAINDNWQYLLFVIYAAYSIKANDGSLNEADRLKREFEANFNLLQENRFKAIATAYQDEYFGGVYQMDTTVGLNTGWFGNDNNDNSW